MSTVAFGIGGSLRLLGIPNGTQVGFEQATSQSSSQHLPEEKNAPMANDDEWHNWMTGMVAKILIGECIQPNSNR